jgi:hypothetical protein
MSVTHLSRTGALCDMLRRAGGHAVHDGTATQASTVRTDSVRAVWRTAIGPRGSAGATAYRTGLRMGEVEHNVSAFDPRVMAT